MQNQGNALQSLLKARCKLCCILSQLYWTNQFRTFVISFASQSIIHQHYIKLSYVHLFYFFLLLSVFWLICSKYFLVRGNLKLSCQVDFDQYLLKFDFLVILYYEQCILCLKTVHQRNLQNCGTVTRLRFSNLWFVPYCLLHAYLQCYEVIYLFLNFVMFQYLSVGVSQTFYDILNILLVKRLLQMKSSSFLNLFESIGRVDISFQLTMSHVFASQNFETIWIVGLLILLDLFYSFKLSFDILA